jgi:microcystin-dependent protein
MKSEPVSIRALTLLALALSPFAVFSQTTAFNYTGYLLEGGTPANGSNDLQFTLYAVPSGGAPLAGSVTRTNQPVINGVFVASLDFGDVFDGSARWLEISARPGGSANPFTNTFPRQAITAAPQATFANNGTPAGGIIAFAGTNPPAGWLLCDGSAVSRASYARLFAAIGMTWGGGDGTTTFNLPDLRGIFLRGAGANSTRTNASGSFYDGGSIGLYSEDRLQGHRHTFYPKTTYGFDSRIAGASSGGTQNERESSNGIGIGNPQTDYINGVPRIGAETKPASYSVNYIIKY